MKKLALVLLLSCSSLSLFAQHIFSTTKGSVSFFSETLLENIQADNSKTAAIINAETNEMAVQMRITDFQFPNKLMQEHFNENYLESEKFPTSVFKGKIKEKADLNVAGTYQVTAEGTLTMHGVSHQVLIPGTVVSDGKQLKLDFKFPVKLEDYKIEIPTIVFSKIAEVVDVSGSMVLDKK